MRDRSCNKLPSHIEIRYLFQVMIKVAVGIIQRNGTVLVCQRKRTALYPMKWEFPGGKVEAGESPEACLLRELREELNISPTEVAFFFERHYIYPDSGKFHLLYYFIRSFTGIPVNKAFESIQWVDPDTLREIDMLEGNREAIDALLKET